MEGREASPDTEEEAPEAAEPDAAPPPGGGAAGAAAGRSNGAGMFQGLGLCPALHLLTAAEVFTQMWREGHAP